MAEIMRVLHADGDGTRVQYTVVDGKGGYFQNVKRLAEFSATEVVLRGRKGGVRVAGRGLSIGRYGAGDAAVYGDVISVTREE